MRDPIIKKEYRTINMGDLSAREADLYMLWTAAYIAGIGHPCIYISGSQELRQVLYSKALIKDWITLCILKTKATSDDFEISLTKLDAKRTVTKLRPNGGTSGYRLFRGKPEITRRRNTGDMGVLSTVKLSRMNMFDKLIIFLRPKERTLDETVTAVGKMLGTPVSKGTVEEMLNNTTCFTKRKYMFTTYYSVVENEVNACRLELSRQTASSDFSNSNDIGYDIASSQVLALFLYGNKWMTVDEIINLLTIAGKEPTIDMVRRILAATYFEKQGNQFRVKGSKSYMIKKNDRIHNALMENKKIIYSGGSWIFTSGQTDEDRIMMVIKARDDGSWMEVNSISYALGNEGIDITGEKLKSFLLSRSDIQFNTRENDQFRLY
jgi:hypothetical protein